MFVIFQGKIIRDKHTTKMAESVGDPFIFYVKDVTQTHWYMQMILHHYHVCFNDYPTNKPQVFYSAPLC